MKKCPKCGFENAEHSKFCNECGFKMEVAEDAIDAFKNTPILDDDSDDLNTINNSEVSETVKSNNLIEANIIEQEPKKKFNFTVKKTIILAVCIVAVVGIICIGLTFKHYKDNVDAANNVINIINDIGEVFATSECENKINSAFQAYNSLTNKQKSYVSNIDILTAADKTYKTKEADLNMIVLATSLKNNAELCQAFFSDYSGVWYNAIYRKTDEYNKGDFSDFNNALRAFQSSDTYVTATTTLNTLNKTIVNTWAKLKDAPVSDTETLQALKDVYTAYQPLYSLATNPEGSYKSYTAEVQRLNGNYKTAYAALVTAMPSLGTTN